MTNPKKLFVFDLDFTLWNAGGTWCDHTNPPYARVNGYIEDALGSKIVLYKDVKDILQLLSEANIPMALASRTGAPSWARELLRLFSIEHYFKHEQIYPGSKVEHFGHIQEATGIDFSDMVFFDDEMRNIHDVGRLGVEAVLVNNGVTMNIIKKYL